MTPREELEKLRRLRELEARAAQANVSAEVAAMREGGALRRGLRGAGASLQNMGYGIKGVFTDLSPEERQDIEINRRFLEEDTAGKVGGFAADVASFALPGGVVAKGITKGVTMLPRAAQGLTALGANAAVDAGLSAAYATEDKSEAALTGALGSVGGQALGRTLARVGGGVVRPSAQAQKLMAEGVQPTIGQAADNSLTGRALRRGEEMLESVPLIGGVVRNARERARSELGEAALRRAVPPGGTPVGAPSREAMQNLKQQFNQAYSVLDTAIFKPDINFERQVMNIVNDPDNRMTAEQRRDLVEFFGKHFTKQFRQGPQQVGAFLDGQGLKEFESKISERIRDLAASGSAFDKGERRALTQLDAALTQFRNAQLPKPVADSLAETDRAYANYKRVLRAAGYSGADSGAFTPAQLNRAVVAMSKGNQAGQGLGLMQDLTDAGSILKSRTPNSGTADRVAAMGLMGGAIANPAAFGPYAAGAAGTAGLYTRPIQRFMLGGYNYQKALEEALRNQARLAGSVAASQFYE